MAIAPAVAAPSTSAISLGHGREAMAVLVQCGSSAAQLMHSIGDRCLLRGYYPAVGVFMKTWPGNHWDISKYVTPAL